MTEDKYGKEEQNKEVRLVYVEPADYFPKRLRKKYKLGEFAEPEAKPEDKKK